MYKRERQTDRQTDRDRDRQTETERDRDREREGERERDVTAADQSGDNGQTVFARSTLPHLLYSHKTEKDLFLPL